MDCGSLHGIYQHRGYEAIGVFSHGNEALMQESRDLEDDAEVR
jgi:hypothetical protein